MRTLSRLLLSACLVAVVAACGPNTPPINGQGGNRGGASSSGGTGGGSGGSSSSAAATAGQVSISATTYAQGDPCSMLPVKTAIGNVSNDCFHEWSAIDPQWVPGQDLMSSTAIPHVAVYSADTPASTASQVATAYFRAAHFRDFTILWWERAMLKALEPNSQLDPVAVSLAQGGFANPIPACSYPQAIGVATLTPGEVQAVGGGGASPGDVAVVLHFGDCAGVPVHFGDGTTALVAPTPSGRTVVELGAVQTVAPFGDIWVASAQADCSSALARPCAVVRS